MKTETTDFTNRDVWAGYRLIFYPWEGARTADIFSPSSKQARAAVEAFKVTKRTASLWDSIGTGCSIFWLIYGKPRPFLRSALLPRLLPRGPVKSLAGCYHHNPARILFQA